LIVENQTTEVNVVSGATYSYQGIIEGAKNAPVPHPTSIIVSKEKRFISFLTL
jgi:hypothetical protein